MKVLTQNKHQQLEDSYKDIFEQRGNHYHQAMMKCPAVRKYEFEFALNSLQSYTKIKDNDTLIDVPSGGGYLRPYCPGTIKYIALDESEIFLKHIQKNPNNTAYCFKNNKIPLKSESADFIISIAGLHHNSDLKELFKEIHRILKPGCYALLADVKENSNVDIFLNEFVNSNNSLGHKGNFLNHKTLKILKDCSFDIIFSKTVCYPWVFKSEKEMIWYCQNLFGLDLCDEKTIKYAIKKILDYRFLDEIVNMNWNLEHILIQK